MKDFLINIILFCMAIFLIISSSVKQSTNCNDLESIIFKNACIFNKKIKELYE